MKRHLGMRSAPLTPMAAVGVKASEAKSTKGCQNQKCVKTAMPTMPPICFWPDLEMSEMVTLRPPASSSPVARMAPNLAITSSCLSPTTLARRLRCSACLESSACSLFCIRTMLAASSAPCRT